MSVEYGAGYDEGAADKQAELAAEIQTLHEQLLQSKLETGGWFNAHMNLLREKQALTGERDALKAARVEHDRKAREQKDELVELHAIRRTLTAQLERARMPPLIRAALRRLINDPVVQTGAKFLSADLTDWLDQQEQQK